MPPAMMTSVYGRVMRWVHVVLFALAPVLSAGACDCCERGACPERCGTRQAVASCCCSDAPRSEDAPSCCSDSVCSPSADCGVDGCDAESGPCRCWIEPKETSAGQDERNHDLDHSSIMKVAGFASQGPCDSREHRRLAVLSAQEWSSSLIPRRPVRVLYGVWRN